jgi:two-component system sensor histidine kinase/response regulator
LPASPESLFWTWIDSVATKKWRQTGSKGSTFHVLLPLTESAGPQAESVPLPPETTPNLRILVAEDNIVNQKLIVTLLKRLGHTVTLAGNGQEAVDLWSGNVFDIVLMDMQMPVLGGMEATTLIRQLERERRVERATLIYALSASAMEHEQQLGLAGGLDGYLTKPLDRKALVDVLNHVAAATRNA